LVSAINHGEKVIGSPSISTRRPIVFFQCFPARAMRRKRISPSRGMRCRRERCCAVEFTRASVSGVPPEKKEWMLYISVYVVDSGM
jgi:hypothetical protein